MQPGTMILLEGTLSLVLPIGWAVWELLSMRPGSPPDRDPTPVVPTPVLLSPGSTLPRVPALVGPERVRVLEDA
jgi:hypothetical protein